MLPVITDDKPVTLTAEAATARDWVLSQFPGMDDDAVHSAALVLYAHVIGRQTRGTVFGTREPHEPGYRTIHFQ